MQNRDEEPESVCFAARSDIGKVRETNEDRFLVDKWCDGTAILAVIADGTGSESGSSEAADITINEFRRLLDQPLPDGDELRYGLLLSCFRSADEKVRALHISEPSLARIGCTVVAAIVSNTKAIHAYAGDCRLYHISKARSPYVTTDHSIVQILMDAGQVTEDQARSHPMRSTVTSLIGSDQPPLVSPVWQRGQEEQPSIRSLSTEDILLLCSDGVHRQLSEQRILDYLTMTGAQPIEILDLLIDMCLKAGGQDNITAIVIRVPTPPEADEAILATASTEPASLSTTQESTFGDSS